jgi:hypothetical protein
MHSEDQGLIYTVISMNEWDSTLKDVFDYSWGKKQTLFSMSLKTHILKNLKNHCAENKILNKSH